MVRFTSTQSRIPIHLFVLSIPGPSRFSGDMSSDWTDASALFGEGRDCTSWDVPVSDGGLKTRIHRHAAAEDDVEPLTICHESSDSYFNVTTKLTTCIHGSLAVPEEGKASIPATLLVLEYDFYPKPGHRFTNIYTSISFRNVQGIAKKKTVPPKVIAYAPFPRPRLFQRDLQLVKRDRGVSGKLGVDGGLPVDAELEGHKSTNKAHLQEFFAKGYGGTNPNKDSDVHGTVWWSLEENSLQKHGVLPKLVVGVLIERANDSDFLGDFNLDVHGTFDSGWRGVGQRVLSFIRSERLDKPVKFSPKTQKLQDNTSGIDPLSLMNHVKDMGDGKALYIPDSYHLESFLPSPAEIGVTEGERAAWQPS